MATSPPRPPPTRDPRQAVRRILAVVIAGVVAVLATVVILATVPVPQTTTFTYDGGIDSAIPANDTKNVTLCPTGAKASVSYSSGGLNLTFTIVAPNAATLWSQRSPQGSTTFTVPACGTYHLTASGDGNGHYTVTGTLSYSAPLL